jgi:hypothetical protein
MDTVICYGCLGEAHGPVLRDPETNQGYVEDCQTCDGTGRVPA